MMEYFAYKKVKKHQAEKKRVQEGQQQPVLSAEDEHFLGSIISAEGTPPALPDRPHYLNTEVGDSTGNSAQIVVAEKQPAVVDETDDQGKGKGKENAKPEEKEKKKKTNRFSTLLGRMPTINRGKSKKAPELVPNDSVMPNEAHKEEDDINRVLDELNLAAVNNRAFSISKESQELVQKFTVILKDLVNGVPTAYDDLVNLLEDSQGTLAKSYDHLPSFLQKLITTLPQKLTSTLAPELLAVATEAQAFAGVGGAAAASGLGEAVKSFLTPTSLKDLVTKPGAVVGMLKYIMNALKMRWPAFMGTNVLWSLGLFVLLFVFWYCHKRGRDVRLAKERMVDSEGRIVEVGDDPMLTGPAPRASGDGRLKTGRKSGERRSGERSSRDHERRPVSGHAKEHPRER